MAIIGNFFSTENGYTGTIETLTLKAELELQPCHKSSDKAPDYRVFRKNSALEVGAAWATTSPRGDRYVSLKLDDPSFAAAINCRLTKTGVEHGYSLIWERDRKRS